MLRRKWSLLRGDLGAQATCAKDSSRHAHFADPFALIPRSSVDPQTLHMKMLCVRHTGRWACTAWAFVPMLMLTAATRTALLMGRL